MKERGRDPSIESEPQFAQQHFEADQTELQAERVLRFEAQRDSSADAVEHTVWDEPVLSGELAGQATADQLTYARWLAKKQAETSWRTTWLVTLAVALVAGPWGVLGALMAGGDSATGLTLVVLIGPITEEVMKVAAPLWVVEKKPYLFKSVGQILLCGAAGGAAFGFIENLMYLYVYIPEHSAKLAAWRWSVCMGLHMNCSFVAGVGVARIWYNAVRERHRPQLWLGLPWLFIAMVAHGAYNGATVVAEAMGWLEL